MAAICTRFADRANTGLMEFCCDSVSEVQDAPTTTTHGRGVFENYKQCAPMGSTLICGNDGNETLIYMLFSFGWKEI